MNEATHPANEVRTPFAICASRLARYSLMSPGGARPPQRQLSSRPSLPTLSPSQPRTPARKAEVLDLAGERQTLRWREEEFNLYGAFPVKRLFWFADSFLFGAGKPFFVPSPAIRFAERAEGVKGPKR